MAISDACLRAALTRPGPMQTSRRAARPFMPRHERATAGWSNCCWITAPTRTALSMRPATPCMPPGPGIRRLLEAHGGYLDPYDLVWKGKDDEVMRVVTANPEAALAGCGGVFTAMVTTGNRKLLHRLLDAGFKVHSQAGGCHSYLLEQPDMLGVLLQRGGLDPQYPTPEGVRSSTSSVAVTSAAAPWSIAPSARRSCWSSGRVSRRETATVSRRWRGRFGATCQIWWIG